MSRNKNRNRNKNAQDQVNTINQPKPQETVMSENSTNPEVHETKPNPAQSSNTPVAEKKSDDAVQTEEKKSTILDIAMAPFTFAWNKIIVPVYEFGKGVVLKAWNKAVEMFEHEKALFEQLGVTQYLLDRTSKALIGILKLAAAVTVAYYLAVFAQAYLNINLFAPTSLLVIAGIALVMIVGRSYLAQKDAGQKFSVETAGSHIMDAVAA